MRPQRGLSALTETAEWRPASLPFSRLTCDVVLDVCVCVRRCVCVCTQVCVCVHRCVRVRLVEATLGLWRRTQAAAPDHQRSAVKRPPPVKIGWGRCRGAGDQFTKLHRFGQLLLSRSGSGGAGSGPTAATCAPRAAPILGPSRRNPAAGGIVGPSCYSGWRGARRCRQTERILQ